MVRKRPHTKSRTGCDGCKKRRVKCDETRPCCSNCTLRDLECHFSRPPSALRSFTSFIQNDNPETYKSVSPGTISTSPPAPIPGEASTDVNQSCYSQSTRLRELELMHQWCTETCYSFTNAVAPIFRSYVAKEALKHEFLMDSILALSSLHLASESDDPDAVASYVSSALQYQNNALPTLYTALRTITPSNCNAVFAAAIINMASAIASSILPTGNNDRLESTTTSVVLLLDYLKGIGSVVSLSRQWIEGGPLNILLHGHHKVANGMEIESVVPIQNLRRLNDDVTGNTNPHLHEIYERAIAQLEVCFVISKTMAMTWLIVAGKEFVNELRNGELMAQLIFMYLGVLFNRLDNMWWARRSGKRLVEELAGNLLNQGGEWAIATRWAMVQVGCEDISLLH